MEAKMKQQQRRCLQPLRWGGGNPKLHGALSSGARGGAKLGREQEGWAASAFARLASVSQAWGGAFAPSPPLSPPASQPSLGSSPMPAQLAEGPGLCVAAGRPMAEPCSQPKLASKQERGRLLVGCPWPALSPRPSLGSRRPGPSEGPLGCRPSRRGWGGGWRAGERLRSLQNPEGMAVQAAGLGWCRASGLARVCGEQADCAAAGPWSVAARVASLSPQPPPVSWAGAKTAREGLPGGGLGTSRPGILQRHH